MDDRTPPDTDAPRPLVVTGMHGSATSLAASLVAGLGVNLGERLLAADAHNPAGYFEDLDFVELQSRMMLAATPDDDGGHPDWGWTEHQAIDPRALEPWRDAALSLVAARASRGRPWGWKNPRTAASLDFWDSLLPDARYLLIYRYPWEVADSLQRLGVEVFLRNPRYAYAIWELYNRRILEILERARDRCLLVSANALLSDPERLDGLLRDRLGLAAPDGYVQSKVRPDLFRSGGRGWDPLVTLLEAVRPGCLDLLRELDRWADLPSAGLWGAPPRASWSGGPGAPPSVSVVVPCYNHGELLLEAVASAEQACREEPLEVVIVDDGSDEPWTLEVLENLRRLGYRVLRQPNRGLAAARNAGAAAASGELLLPLDADDRLRPDFPAAARRVLEAEAEVGVVYCDHWEFGLRTGHVRAPDFKLARLLRGNYVAACACLRRRVWEECGGWDEALSAWEDWELWIGAAGRGWRFHRFPGIGFDYRKRPDSMATACLRAEVGMPLQEHIVRKHQAVYLLHLPELLVEAQDAVREADAARQELAEIRKETDTVRRELGQALRRLEEEESQGEQLASREARLVRERDRLYQELEAWRERVAFMEGTSAWRMRRWLLALKRSRGGASRVGAPAGKDGRGRKG